MRTGAMGQVVSKQREGGARGGRTEARAEEAERVAVARLQESWGRGEGARDRDGGQPA